MSSTSDYFNFDDLLKPEEQAIRNKVRECMEKEIAPIMTKACLSFLLIALILFVLKKIGQNSAVIYFDAFSACLDSCSEHTCVK